MGCYRNELRAAIASRAVFREHEVTGTYKGPCVASNNTKSISKSIGVKVSPLLFAKVLVLVSAILPVQSIGIVIGTTFCICH